MKGDKPIYATREGTLSVSVWENKVTEGTTKKSVQIDVSYKKKTEETWTHKKVNINFDKIDKLIEMLKEAKEKSLN